MKKKLLSILLSLFLAVTVFTVNAFADDVTVGNLLNTVDDGFPTTETDGWICQYGTAAYLDTDNLIIVDPATSQNISILTSTVLTQDGNNYKYVKDQSFEVLFEMNNNKLIQFTTSSTVTIEQQTITIILTYKIFGNRMTMPDLFSNYGEDFPTEEEDAWINTSRSTSKMYLDNNTLYIFDIEESGMSIPLMLVLDVLELNTKYSLSMSGISIDFIIDDGQLNKVVVNNYPGLEYLEGTYIAPITVADILDTIGSEYPSSVDDVTVPDGCFTTKEGYRLYYSSDRSELYISDTPFISISASQPLTQDADGNYTADIELEIFSFTVNISFKMIMSNNKLQRIEATRNEDSFVFEPLGNRYTFDMLFKTLGDKKPNSDTNAWVNENGYRIYVDDDDELLTLHEANFGIYPLFSCLNPSGNNYSNTFIFADMLPSVVTANMNGSVITSLNINYSDEDIDSVGGLGDQQKQMLKDIRGIYEPYKIVNDPVTKSIGYNGEIEFKTYATYTAESDVTVKVDGVTLDPATDYTVRQGSTIVTLSSSFVNSISGTNSEHTISISVDGYGEVTQKFFFSNDPQGGGSSSSDKHYVLNTGVN